MVKCRTRQRAHPASYPSHPSVAPDLQYILQGVYVDLSFPVCLTMGSARSVSSSQEGTPWLHTLHQLVRKSSLQNPMNQESWGFIHPKNQTSATQWSRSRESTYQAITLRLPQFPQALAPQERYRLLELQSAAPLFPWNLSPVLLGTILIGGIIFLISYSFLRYVIARIFPLPSFCQRKPDAGSPGIRKKRLDPTTAPGT